MNHKVLFNFEKLKEYDNHRFVTYISDIESGLKAYVVIHRGGLQHPSFGATRIFHYTSEREALEDVLRLSRLMSYKSAISGLNYGGAKAVIIANVKTSAQRKKILKAYSKSLDYLRHHFVTGADVGVDIEDLPIMAKEYPAIVGIKSDAIKYTAIGVLLSINVCLKEIFGNSKVAGRTFAIQGLGKIGTELLNQLYPEAEKIYVCDVNPKRVAFVKDKYPNVEVIRPDDIYALKVDVFCPCALSTVINPKTITRFNCKIIVGSANSQLLNKEMGILLKKLGILYAPDYIVNAGGLIAVVSEYENPEGDEEEIMAKVQNIPETLKKVFKKANQEDKAINIVADKLAESFFKKFD